MCMIDSAEACKFSKAKRRKARKPHWCSECGRQILAGEEYEHVSGIFEDSWFKAKTCSHCQQAREWLARNCGGYVGLAVQLDLEEHIDEMGAGGREWFELGRLVVGMRRKWQRFDGAGLMALKEAA